MSPPWASNSASFLRSSASSRLTWKDSDRRGISLGHLPVVAGVGGALAEIRVPFGFVDDDLQAEDFDVVPDLRLKLEQVLPGLVVRVPVHDALHELDDGDGQVGLGPAHGALLVAVGAAATRALVNVTLGSVAVLAWPSGPVQLTRSVRASS